MLGMGLIADHHRSPLAIPRHSPSEEVVVEQELQHRGGCSWMSIAVVSVVLLLGFAIFIPAVLDAREAARRSSCKGRHKQLGIALHNYHETHSTFPPGWLANGGEMDGKPEESAYSWRVLILPFMDCNPLYKTINFDAPFQTEVQTEKDQKLVGVATSLGMIADPYLRCPSEFYGSVTDTTSSVPAVPTSNYVANFGVGIPRYGRHYGQLLQGVFAQNSRIRIRDIRDGTTNVVMAGERRLVVGGQTWSEGKLEGALNSYWPGFPRGTSPLSIVATGTDGEYPEAGCDEDTIKAHRSGALNLYGELNGLALGSSLKGALRMPNINGSLSGNKLKSDEVSINFSSHHPGGAHVVLADGSVRFLSETFDREELLCLFRRADGMCVRGSY